MDKKEKVEDFFATWGVYFVVFFVALSCILVPIFGTKSPVCPIVLTLTGTSLVLWLISKWAWYNREDDLVG